MTYTGEHQIQLIIGDSVCSRTWTDRVFKGKSEKPLLEETTLGLVVYGGDERGSNWQRLHVPERGH